MDRYLRDKADDHTPSSVEPELGILRKDPKQLPALMGWKEGDLITIDAGHGPVVVEYYKVSANRTWWRGCSSHRLYNDMHANFLEMWLKGRG